MKLLKRLKNMFRKPLQASPKESKTESSNKLRGFEHLANLAKMSNDYYDKLANFIVTDVGRILGDQTNPELTKKEREDSLTELSALCVALMAISKQTLHVFPESERNILLTFSDQLYKIVVEEARSVYNQYNTNTKTKAQA